jgi:histidinol-phosphate aminotransferase
MIRSLMRRDLLTLEAEPPLPAFEEIERRVGHKVAKLDSNENPYGFSPRVSAALGALDLARYPDAGYGRLRGALAEYVGTEVERIAVGAGGDAIIDLLLRLFLEPGDEVIDLSPSFVMYELSALYNHGVILRVPRDRQYGVDVEGIAEALAPRTKVIFFCNPNNPTGNLSPEHDIVRVLEMGRIVVLDEAYAEFAGTSAVHLTTRYPNLVILRTMSKWAGLAGIRLGYAVADPAVVDAMRRITSPFGVSVAAQAAGLASLQDREYLMEHVGKIIEERERLYNLLRGLGRGRVLPSTTSFLFWEIEKAPTIQDALAREGVFVRGFHTPLDALRISVGTPDDTDILMDALSTIQTSAVAE